MIKCEIMDACEKNGFEGCCESCPDKEGCDVICTDKSATCGNAVFDESNSLQVFQTQTAAIINTIVEIVTVKNAMEIKEKAMREQLQTAMEYHGIKKVDHDLLKINYIEPSTRTSIDGPKVKSKYPHIYDECSKTTSVKGHVKIELKKG